MARDVDVDAEWMASQRARLEPFHDILAGDGVLRGVIGPREQDRLWNRHLWNCVAVVDPSLGLVQDSARVVDVGSGGGLPGIAWALARPDLQLTLVEPLQRRIAFLGDTVNALGLTGQVELRAVRAQDIDEPLGDVVTSRALSSLVDIVKWSLPLLAPGGSIVAMKGARAEAELDEARESIQRMGIGGADVVRIGPTQADGHPWATVIVMRREAS